MTDPQHVAKAAEVGGALITTTCAACRWIVVNHDFLASAGLIFGPLLGIAGFALSWYYQHQTLKNNLRQKKRRQ